MPHKERSYITRRKIEQSVQSLVTGSLQALKYQHYKSALRLCINYADQLLRSKKVVRRIVGSPLNRHSGKHQKRAVAGMLAMDISKMTP